MDTGVMTLEQDGHLSKMDTGVMTLEQDGHLSKMDTRARWTLE